MQWLFNLFIYHNLEIFLYLLVWPCLSSKNTDGISSSIFTNIVGKESLLCSLSVKSNRRLTNIKNSNMIKNVSYLCAWFCCDFDCDPEGCRGYRTSPCSDGIYPWIVSMTDPILSIRVDRSKPRKPHGWLRCGKNNIFNNPHLIIFFFIYLLFVFIIIITFYYWSVCTTGHIAKNIIA